VLRIVLLIAIGACLLLLAACQPAALALLGAGATSAVRYSLEGVASRTFTASAPTVKKASLNALERMGIKLESTTANEDGELIVARTTNRDIEIELEPISERATRVRVTARNGGSSIFYDNATALEIVQQTGKMLELGVAAKVTREVAQPARLSAN
jgi:Protein of unknown function (DUF3568)